MKRIATLEDTVERLGRATCAALAAGLGLAALAWPLLMLGMERAALACAALGVGLGTSLGLAVALAGAVVEGLVWRCERRDRASR